MFHADALISKPAWILVDTFTINSFTRLGIVLRNEIEAVIHGPIGKALQITSIKNATNPASCPTSFHKVLMSTIPPSPSDPGPSPLPVDSHDHAMFIATSLGAAFGDAQRNPSSTTDKLRSAQTFFCLNVSVTSQTRFVVLTIHSSTLHTPYPTFPLRHAQWFKSYITKVPSRPIQHLHGINCSTHTYNPGNSPAH